MIKDISGFEGKYAVDEYGNVYSYCVIGSKFKRNALNPRKLIPHTGEKF